jgi:hypothetical protein
MYENLPPKQLIILRPATRKAKAELAETPGLRRPSGSAPAPDVPERALAFSHLRGRISREGALPGDYGSRISS